MPKRFVQSGRGGFYFGGVEERTVEAGDTLERISQHPGGLSVAEVTSLYTTERGNVALLKKAIAATALPESWSGYFEHQLEKLES